MKSPLFFGLTLLVLTSCGTTVAYVQVIPPEIPLTGAKSVGILPFGVPGSSSLNLFRQQVPGFFRFFRFNSSLYTQLSEQATRRVQEIFVQQGEFQVYSQEILIDPNTYSLDYFTDVLVTGDIISWELDEQVSEREVTLEDESVILVKTYTRDVSLSVELRAYSGRDLSLIGQKTLRGSKSHSREEGQEFPTELRMASQLLEDILNRGVKPLFFSTRVRRYHQLLELKGDNPLFKEGLQKAGQGSLSSARIIFEELYVGQEILEAGYNLALIQEAQGDIDQALETMKALQGRGFRDAERQVRRMESRVQRESIYW